MFTFKMEIGSACRIMFFASVLVCNNTCHCRSLNETGAKNRISKSLAVKFNTFVFVYNTIAYGIMNIAMIMSMKWDVNLVITATATRNNLWIICMFTTSLHITEKYFNRTPHICQIYFVLVVNLFKHIFE